MIPLRDDNPTTRTPVVTIGIVALCALAFLAQGGGDSAIDTVTEHLSMVPARVSGDEEVTLQLASGRTRTVEVDLPPAWVPEWLTMLTCTFLHGGWMHLIGNLWVLWIFGDNVEERFGRLRYLLFYLGCGALASLTHYVSDPHSPLPTVGASGAIAGVMGAYLLLYPHARVLTLLPLGILMRVFEAPAWAFLCLWFLLQLLQGLLSVGLHAVGGVAWWAHIGGFVAGLAIAAFLRERERLRPAPQVIALRGRRSRRM